MGFSTDEHMVRVDFFKPSGKWYTTEAVRWTQYKGVLIHAAFRESLTKHLQHHVVIDGRCQHCHEMGVKGTDHCAQSPFRLAGMTAVCLEPYHEHACPIMDVVPGGYASESEMRRYAEQWLSERVVR